MTTKRPPIAALIWVALVDKRSRDAVLFLALDAVPMWARRAPYLWICRKLMAYWHPGLKDGRA